MATGFRRLWTDTCSVYRAAASGVGDPTGYTLISSGNLCRYHGTPNYDQQRGGVQAKEDSVQTSDSLSLGIAVDIRANDVVKITLSTGDVLWNKVQGAPQVRTLLAHKRVFITTMPALEDEEIL